MDFAEPQNENQRKLKDRQILEPCLWNMRMTVISIILDTLRTVSEDLEKKDWRIWKLREESRLSRQSLIPEETCGIFQSSHQPDECSTSPFLGGTGDQAVASTHKAAPKMPRTPLAFP